jgi:ankyrin repeat protein
MKQFIISISLLIVPPALYCMDNAKDDAQKVTFKIALEQQDEYGNTILHHAIEHLAKVESLKYLANPVPCEHEFFDKQLQYIFNNDENCEKKVQQIELEAIVSTCILAKKLADENVKTITEYETQLTTNTIDTITHLHNLGFNFNIQNNEGETALFFAAWYRAPEVVGKLLELGANPNICNEGGISPLKVASEKSNNHGVIQFLLKNGADAGDFFGCRVGKVAQPIAHSIAKASINNLNAFLKHFRDLSMDQRNTLAEEGSQCKFYPNTSSSGESGSSSKEDSEKNNDRLVELLVESTNTVQLPKDRQEAHGLSETGVPSTSENEDDVSEPEIDF